MPSFEAGCGLGARCPVTARSSTAMPELVARAEEADLEARAEEAEQEDYGGAVHWRTRASAKPN
jgi:hypothetical protein